MMQNQVHDQIIAIRRNQILDAATVVFARKGFHTATIRDVAQEAGVADGTIYNYFANKTALLLGIFERMRHSAQQDIPWETVEDMDLRSFLHIFLSQPLETFRDNSSELMRIVVSEMLINDELRTLYQEQVLEPTLALAEPILQNLVDSGRIRAVDVKVTVRAISGMIMGLMIQNIVGDGVLVSKWDALPDLLVDLLVDGLARKQ